MKDDTVRAAINDKWELEKQIRYLLEGYMEKHPDFQVTVMTTCKSVFLEGENRRWVTSVDVEMDVKLT